MNGNHRTQEEIEHVRLAFSSRKGTGIIDTIIKETIHTVQSTPLPKAEELVSFYEKEGYFHIATLLKLAVLMKIEVISSHSIDFYGVAHSTFSSENAASLQTITIGSSLHAISPHEWFAALARGFHRLSKEQAYALDEVCAPIVTHLLVK